MLNHISKLLTQSDSVRYRVSIPSFYHSQGLQLLELGLGLGFGLSLGLGCLPWE